MAVCYLRGIAQQFEQRWAALALKEVTGRNYPAQDKDLFHTTLRHESPVVTDNHICSQDTPASSSQMPKTMMHGPSHLIRNSLTHSTYQVSHHFTRRRTLPARHHGSLAPRYGESTTELEDGSICRTTFKDGKARPEISKTQIAVVSFAFVRISAPAPTKLPARPSVRSSLHGEDLGRRWVSRRQASPPHRMFTELPREQQPT